MKEFIKVYTLETGEPMERPVRINPQTIEAWEYDDEYDTIVCYISGQAHHLKASPTVRDYFMKL